MCHIISLILKDHSKEEAYARVLMLRKWKLVKLEDWLATKYLKPDEFIAYPRSDSCDCGTALGTYHIEVVLHRVSQHEIEKQRKKGWSETKIKRWLEEIDKVNAREKRIQKEHFNDLGKIENPDPDGWIKTISQLIEESGEKYIGILLQWSPGKHEIEHALRSNRKKVSIAKNAGIELYKMEEDKIYEVYK